MTHANTPFLPVQPFDETQPKSSRLTKTARTRTNAPLRCETSIVIFLLSYANSRTFWSGGALKRSDLRIFRGDLRLQISDALF
jgi:hypothetical protein